MEFVAGTYLFVVFFLLAFLADKVPFFKGMGQIVSRSQSSIHTIRSTELSDDEKQKRLLSNSGAIFLESFKIIGLSILLIAFLFIFLHLAEITRLVTYENLENYLITTPGIIISILSFSLYFLAKWVYAKLRV